MPDTALVLRRLHHLRLRARAGQDRIAAIDFVAGAVSLGEAEFSTLIGPGFLDHFAGATADDLPTNIGAMRALVKAFPATSFPRSRSRRCWARA